MKTDQRTLYSNELLQKQQIEAVLPEKQIQVHTLKYVKYDKRIG